MTCGGTRRDGQPCRATALPGSDRCLWHDERPAAQRRRRDASRRGGLTKAYGSLPSTAPLADGLDVANLDLASAAGVVQLLGETLGALARLPFDVRTANAIAQVATSQRAALEASALEARVGALETAARAGLHGEPPARMSAQAGPWGATSHPPEA